jgi:8-oxo-dGTP pyrophosphatase MutT (NUDIX family)
VLTQYGVIPVRRTADDGIEVLLITSRDTGRWVVPRGNPIPGKSPAESAAQEAYEEAGIIGPVEAEAIGLYSYEKRRRLRGPLPAVVHLFRMDVAEERDDWPEKGQRERRWFRAEEAAAAVHEADLAGLIRRASVGPSQK